MTSIVLLYRLARRDLRRRPAEALLLLAALAVASTTLTIGLVLHGQTAVPYAETRQRTSGPDVVAALFPPPGRSVTGADRDRLAALAGRREVAARSPAFPTTWASIEAAGVNGVAEVQGRDANPSPVDRPAVVSGHWVDGDHGGVVVERAFARALGVDVGDHVTLDGQRLRVVGVAVSAALPPYPQLCTIGCILDRPGWPSAQPGLVWAPRHEVGSLSSGREPVVWFQYLRLHDPSTAPAFAARYGADGPPTGRTDLEPWQAIAARQAEQLSSERTVVVFGSTLLVVLALATLAVLVGGRMADEVSRVGTLKAAGATPAFVARLLLASYLAVGLVAAAVGLVAGRVLAPRLVARSAGLLGASGPTSVSVGDVLIVVGTILAVVVVASVIPAWRAARTSTVHALAGAGRTPHRSRLIVRASAGLPPPALFGLRFVARRPRRTLLTAMSIAVAVCGSVVALYAQASLRAERGPAGGPADPQVAQLHTVLLAVTLLLVVMTAVNLVFVATASAVDARRLLAVARTLGATPAESAASLGVAQVLPAIVGLVLGFVAGSAIFRALAAHTVTPPLAQLAGLALLAVCLVVALTAVPARIEALRPIAETLREA
ncbi:MAG: FtsX-like permease family protein [Nocardioides sp.]|nr:FtsX-like permease family protein [Nocardioides sp.]